LGSLYECTPFLLANSAFVLLGAPSTYALQATKVDSYFCPPGSQLDKSWVVLIYEDGRLTSGYGVCCDGTPWAKSFGVSAPSFPGRSVGLTTSMTWVSTGSLAITADAAIDLQIINLRTGQEIRNVYHYTQVGTTVVYDVSDLPPGLYGVGVYRNGAAVDLKPFSTIN
jgi:hypothetical protein